MLPSRRLVDGSSAAHMTWVCCLSLRFIRLSLPMLASSPYYIYIGSFMWLTVKIGAFFSGSNACPLPFPCFCFCPSYLCPLLLLPPLNHSIDTSRCYRTFKSASTTWQRNLNVVCAEDPALNLHHWWANIREIGPLSIVAIIKSVTFWCNGRGTTSTPRAAYQQLINWRQWSMYL